MERFAGIGKRAGGQHGLVTFTWQARVLAEVLSAGPDAMASHRTAAALWGLDGFHPPRVVDITLPRGRRPRPRRDVRIHLSQDLQRAARTKRQGIAVTGICRTLLDLCEGRVDIAERALHSARRLRLFNWRELWRCLFDHSRRGRAGVTNLRNLLERWAGTEPTDTDFEQAVLQLLVEGGL